MSPTVIEPGPRGPRDSLALVLVKSVVAAAGVCVFLHPLATPTGVIAGGIGVVVAYLLARFMDARGVRAPAGIAIAIVLGVIAKVGGQLLLDHPIGALAGSLRISDIVLCGLGSLAVVLGIRMLSQVWRPAAVLELALVVGPVARTFAAHRHHHIHEPRFVTDWAWSHGIDPMLVFEGFGVAAIVVAAIMLLDLRRASKLVVSAIFLFGLGIAAYYLLRDIRIDGPTDTNGIGLTKDGQGSGDGSGSGSGSGSNNKGGGGGKPPDPVAVVVWRDELPESEVFYLRQAVQSRFAVDRLVEDTSGEFDKDVIKSFPSANHPSVAETTQNPKLNKVIHTSVYLLVDHAQPFSVGQGFEYRQLDNPNPRQFVAAYDADSFYLDLDLKRLEGHAAGNASWTPAERAHYLDMPADPRYRELSNKIIRDMDPRFVGDDLMTALMLKRYLEQNGFYSLAQKSLVGTDPTAKFLFGDMKGYCVHFAHAMVFLARSQGIPARVAIGYAVQTGQRGAGSSMLVFGNRAHAWPEIYLDGVGWVTFDVYPEHSDEPPPQQVDGDLESLLGELARKDKTGGKAADPDTELEIPWLVIGGSLGSFAGGALLAAYAIKLARRRRRSSQRVIYVGVLDRLTDLGLRRQVGETRERHAARVADRAPSFVALTRMHLRASLGAATAPPLPEVVALARKTSAELRAHTPLWRRTIAVLNPIGWWFTS